MVKIITQAFRRRVREVLVKKEAVQPIYYDVATEDICDWFRNHHREFTEDEMVDLLRPYQ
jgi:hypothetical protein